MTRVADIRRLSREEAAKGLPVSLRGVCTWVGRGVFFVHDGTEGVWVSAQGRRVNGQAPGAWESGALEVGAELELQGVTSSGAYAPAIYLREARRVGRRELPPARRLPMGLLMAGNADAQRVEIEGVVQEAGAPWEGGLRLTMMVDGDRCALGVGVDLATASRWVDARVRVRAYVRRISTSARRPSARKSC